MAQSVNPVPDNNMTIVKTTVQWNDKAIASWVVPRGCLCVELTSDRKAKAKIGEGNKHYYQLPYLGGDGGDLSDYYTKEEINRIIANMQYLGIASNTIYPSKDNLPSTGNRLGDIRYVVNPNDPTGDPLVYLWNGSKWIVLGGLVDIDLSAYAKKSEVNPRLDALEAVAHTHTNKNTLDALTPSVIQNSHMHPNKTTLDQITMSVITDSHKHDNKSVLDQITQSLIDDSHTHLNKDVLDETTASYTIPEKTKLASLRNYGVFIGTDGTSAGSEGLVPAPQATDQGKFLSADGSWETVDTTIPPATTTTIGGVIVGSGLAVDQYGILSTSGGGGGSEVSYVAGEGISIDQGSATTDLTSLPWELGTISDVTGLDDASSSCIRSPYIASGLTQAIGITTDYNGTDLLYKIAFYDSNHQFISMTQNWINFSNMANKPSGCSYIRIVMTLDNMTTMDPSNLNTCNLSYPIEIGKYVITNTGVTHIELDGASIKKIENGNTETLVTFGEDLNVNAGVVNIADINRLILNCEE